MSCYRGWLVRVAVAELRKKLNEADGAAPEHADGFPIQVFQWLPWYGRDPQYASRRIRRIVEKAYAKVSPVT